MLKKFSAAALLISLLMSCGTAQAYDLPKVKPDKKISTTAKQKSGSTLKSDWTSAELFEQKIKARLATGERLAPDDPIRVAADPNFIFIAFYNDAPYFLDKYSIKVRKNVDGKQVWQQKIFPITKKFSPKNAKATQQTFCLTGGKFYNSSGTKDELATLTDEADKAFLEECFLVGYRFAFGHAAPYN